MLERVTEVIRRYRMFGPGGRVGVAVSGGADSVCLLYLLTELAREWRVALSVLHLDHGLRGAESQGDAAFVGELAERLHWPAVIHEGRIDPFDNLEQAAREARLAFFSDSLRDLRLDCIATGHTCDDQAETVLFRFLRGSGTAGLSGIRPVVASSRIVRPLIETSRAEILEYLHARGASWREDSTNATGAFARNRIRRELLPLLEGAWNPSIRHTLLQTAEWARAEEDYWSKETARLAEGCLTESNGFVFTDVEHLAELPLAAARRMVRHAMQRIKGDLRGVEFLHVESILAMAAGTEGHGRVQAAGVDVFRSFNRLRFGRIEPDRLSDRNYRVEAHIPGLVKAPVDNIEITLELIENQSESRGHGCVYNRNMGGLDPDRLRGSLVLRNWRPGDQYQPVGKTRAEKIKTLFQEYRIPLWERRHWPILTNGDSIVWARRFGAAEAFAADERSRRVLQIRESETRLQASKTVALDTEGAEVS